jgi:GR25 family glycosyltransferase involved in LPS biosynthesis
MTYEYSIISIDETRTEKKDRIRSALSWPEAKIDFVNGKDPGELLRAKNKWSAVETPGPFKAGEFGIFYSVLNCLEYGAENHGILYFEDDAIPNYNFQVRLEQYLDDLPRRADMFALWSPINQGYDYDNVSGYNNVGEPIYNPHGGSVFDYGDASISRLWQGYGNVSMYFTKQGSTKLLRYIKQRGFFSPIDCLICIATHGGYLNGYSLKPKIDPLINYDWDAETTIHKSNWGSIEELTKGENK